MCYCHSKQGSGGRYSGARQDKRRRLSEAHLLPDLIVCTLQVNAAQDKWLFWRVLQSWACPHLFCKVTGRTAVPFDCALIYKDLPLMTVLAWKCFSRQWVLLFLFDMQLSVSSSSCNILERSVQSSCVLSHCNWHSKITGTHCGICIWHTAFRGISVDEKFRPCCSILL